MSSSNHDPSGRPDSVDPLERFWDIHAADEVHGRQRSLAEYLELIPGAEDLIAEQYLALKNDPELTAPDGFERIGPYKLIRRLGHGGQGVVWLAEQERPRRKIALKVIHDHQIWTNGIRRFKREVELTAALDHAGVCPIFEVGQTNRNQHYVAMRYVEGASLAELYAGKPMSHDATVVLAGEDRPAPSHDDSRATPSTRDEVQQLLHLIAEVADVLEHAHQRGVIHRDIKPGNIMVDKDGKPVVLDFGMARDLNEDHQGMTGRDTLGTMPYMSPEQRLRTSAVDQRADVWSLGVTLYEGLTGTRPFTGETESQLENAVTTKPHARASLVNGSLPRDLDAVLDMALAKDRDNRYQSASALAEDLRRIIRKEPVQARRTPKLRLALYWVRRHPALTAGLIAIMTMLASAALAAHYRLHAERAQIETRLEAERKLEQSKAKEKLQEQERLQESREKEREEALREAALIEREADLLFPVTPSRLQDFQTLAETSLRIRRSNPSIDSDIADIIASGATADANELVPRLMALELRVRANDEFLDARRGRLGREMLLAYLQLGPTLRSRARSEGFDIRDLDAVLPETRRLELERLMKISRVSDVRFTQAIRARAEESEEMDRNSATTSARLARFRLDVGLPADAKIREDITPIGRNAQGMWEFWVAGTGAAPVDWTPSRHIPHAQDAIVLVCVPAPEREDHAKEQPELLLVGKHEVSRSQFVRIMNLVEVDDLRAATASDYEAERLTNRIRMRLPSIQEWRQHILATGDLEGAKFGALPGNYPPHEGARSTIAAIGSYTPNDHGIHDVIGNVWELTASHGYMEKDDMTISARATMGLSFSDPHKTYKELQYGVSPRFRGQKTGFRIVCDIEG